MNKKYTIDSFFAGVGGIDLGFEQTGRFETKYANEFDKNACKTFEANFPNVYLDGQDIHNVSQEEIPDCDVMIGGFPCQAFSAAGYKRGFEDKRGTLFFEMLRMIQAKRPRVILFENVKNLVTHNDGKTFKVIKEVLIKNGYYITWKVMNAKDYGNLPQNRERIYLVYFHNRSDFRRFHFPEPITRTKTLHDIIDFSDQKPEKYYYRQGRQRFYGQLRHDITSHDTAYQWRRQYTRENKSNVLPTLTANMGTGGSNVPLILTSDNQIRKLTPRECFNGQGFPTNFVLPDDVANTQLYKQAGNSVAVPVIKRIAEQILKAIDGFPDNHDQIGQGDYALVYSDFKNKYEGSSYVKAFAKDPDNLQNIALHSRLPMVNYYGYLNTVAKNKKVQFLMIERV